MHVGKAMEQECTPKLFVYWARSLGGILEEFGWFEGMLEEFMREKHCFG